MSLDLVAAPSGYGHDEYEYGTIHTSFCPDGLPLEFALLTLLAAFGVAFGVLYTALTLTTMGRGFDDDDSPLESHLFDFVWSGMNYILHTRLLNIINSSRDIALSWFYTNSCERFFYRNQREMSDCEIHIDGNMFFWVAAAAGAGLGKVSKLLLLKGFS